MMEVTFEDQYDYSVNGSVNDTTALSQDSHIQHDLTTARNSHGAQNKGPNSELTQMSRKFKMLKSFFLFNAWLGMGLWASLPSPCIDLLKEIAGVNYEQISRPLAVKMVGIIVGSLLFGVITDKFKKKTDLVLSVVLVMAGLSITAVPWIPNLVGMSIAFFVNGMAHGGLSAVGNVHVISLWGKDAPSPLLFIHMGYSLGTILGPVLIGPFLPESVDNGNSTINATSLVFKSAAIDGQTLPFNVHLKSMYLTLFSDSVWDEQEWNSLNSLASDASNNTAASGIRAPFGAAGGYTIVVAAVFLIYACVPYYQVEDDGSDSVMSARTLQRRPSVAEIVSPGSCTGGNTGYGIQMFSMLFFLYIMFSGKDTCVTSFLQPLAVHSPNLSFTLKQADFLITIHYSCYGLGRILMAIIVKWISIKILICTQLVVIVGVQLSLVIFSLDSNLNFWLTTCSYAFISGPILPSGFSWIDRYVKMTACGYAIMNVGIGVGGFLFQWLCGYLYNSKSHNLLFVLSLVCGVVELLLYIVMQYNGHRHGDRYLKVKKRTMSEIIVTENGDVSSADRRYVAKESVESESQENLNTQLESGEEFEIDNDNGRDLVALLT